ncbi:MAG: molybdenum cofactor biosynthesis protein MoaE [Limnochordales bacterium]|nr:molybdenum cofactor biosynthesis protein MoaE [Limnochordales bacterium]
MRVTVRAFAALAETLGRRTMALDLPPGATVQDAWQRVVEACPPAGRFQARLLVAVNHEYATWQTPLSAGDEVAFLPPVSGGGQGAPAAYEVVEEPLSADALLAKVNNPRAGAVVLFAGVVREYTGDRRTVELEYEAYREMAVKEMARIGQEVARQWPSVRLAISHRVGTLAIGETSVLVAAAAPHRGEAFAAARYAIDRLKELVPIWKKERWDDGEEWVGPPMGP